MHLQIGSKQALNLSSSLSLVKGEHENRCAFHLHRQDKLWDHVASLCVVHTGSGRQERSDCLLYSVPEWDFSRVKNGILELIRDGDMSIFPLLIWNSQVLFLEYTVLFLRWHFFCSTHRYLISHLHYSCCLLVREGKEVSCKVAAHYNGTSSKVVSCSPTAVQQNERVSGSLGESSNFHCGVLLWFYERTLEPVNSEIPVVLDVYSHVGLVPQKHH